MRARLRLALVVLMLVGCAPPAETTGARVDEIIGGTPTGSADPEVFALLMFGPYCSATLIHPRVLLTAAHCLSDDRLPGVSNHPDGYWNGSPTVVDAWVHPDYAATQVAEYDIGLVLLATPVTNATPKRFQRTPLTVPGGGRAVGYGQRAVGANPPSGTRYTIDLPLTAVTSGQVRYGTAGSAICFGDSGGPFFATIDGVETVIAVHSYTNDPTCSGGAGARVDANRPILDQWFATNLCPRDGVCDATCPVVDFDCACATDGQCTAACTRPEYDSDCPANCGGDGICAAAACPIPDADCRSAGAPCERANQCAGQRCTSDPQHPALYCSLACSTDADCAPLDDSECDQGTCRLRQVAILPLGAPCQPTDRCVEGARCHASEATRSFCAVPCSQQSDCAENTQCRYGISSWQACVVKQTPPVMLEPVGTEAPAAPKGCSTSGGALVALALTLARRRRPQT